MSQRIAKCHCQRLQLACDGEPALISMCHCDDCERRTGSAFSVAAFFERGAVSVVQGATKSFTRDSATGKPVSFHFCSKCGTSLYWEASRMPHLIGVAVGAFADPNFPQPEQSVWTDEKLAWVSLPAEMRVRA